MGAKQLSYSDEARQKLLAGVSKLARAVRSTLGPRGRNAVIDKGWGSPTVTKDGVTVAEEIELTDPYENMGAQLVKEAASKTSDVAGDGTTAATIAANNDAEIGKKLAEAMKLVGAANGVITIEEGKTAETEVVVVQGMQFDRGYLSPHFVNNPESVTCEFDNPYVLIYEDKISNVKDLIPLLEKTSQVKVGGATETAMKERKALYEDSLAATRAAIEEGIVPGGGVALLHARKVLDKLQLEGD